MEHGLNLAKGDRRGLVAVDSNGEVYSISRWVGVKAKDVRAKFGRGDDLPSVDEVRRKRAASQPTETEHARIEANTLFQFRQDELELKRTAMVARHRDARDALKTKHEKRRISETKARSGKLPKGLKAAWFKLSGQYSEIIIANETEVQNSNALARKEFQSLIESQLHERQKLENEFRALRHENHAVDY